MNSENKEILLVDDDPYMLEALKRCLRRDFRIHTALDPNEALNTMLSGRRYAVVLADIHMPKMSGIEFLTRVAELCPMTVRIAMTGMIQLETRRAALERAKVFKFLTKPCCTHLVIDALYEGLELYRSNCIERERAGLEEIGSTASNAPYDGGSKAPVAVSATSAPPSDPPFPDHAIPRYLVRRA
jgi:DNA-binding NtrC family response regulator